MERTSHPYEEPFLVLLIASAMIGLVWLFSTFIPSILLAILIATATYPLYKRLIKNPRISPDNGAFIATLSVLSLLIFPLTYLFIEGGRMGVEVFTQVQAWIQDHPQGVLEQFSGLIQLLPISDVWQLKLQNWLVKDLGNITQKIQEAGVHLVGNLFSGVGSFITFIAISLFSLFFFYRDGEQFSRRIKNLSPLDNHLDTFIMRRFAELSTVLSVSVLGMAVLQGVTFGLLMQFLGMPSLFLGIAFAIASFIPIVGGLLIWLPTAIYFVMNDNIGTALLVVVYSVVLIGFMIDNILRPIVIRRLSMLRGSSSSHQNEKSILSHTWLTMLSTFAGLLHFGVIGLIFGPMLAAMAITIFDVYEHKHKHQLDYS